MSSTALTVSGQQDRTIRRTNPLLSVMTWELRRFRANHAFLFQVLSFFCLALFVTWAGHDDFGVVNGSVAIDLSVANTSPWGMLQRLPTSGMLVLGLLLPFVAAEGVAQDLSRRTHELLMTTALPGGPMCGAATWPSC